MGQPFRDVTRVVVLAEPHGLPRQSGAPQYVGAITGTIRSRTVPGGG